MSYASGANPTPNPEEEWWKDRWLDALASFGRTLRSARAHNYARQGNVLSIDFKGNKISAKVQGSEKDPYALSISLQSFNDEEWQNVIAAMADQAVFAAKLLAGEMPREIEEVFTSNGLSLFPLTRADIRSRCSCPDKANPCKHIGAVYYLLGDRFGADPFVLFQLRGRSRDQIVTTLRQMRGEQVSEQDATSPNNESDMALDAEEVAGDSSLDLLSADPVQFWRYDAPLESSLVVITPPPTSETVLDVLGPIPLKPDVTGAATQTKASVAMAMEYLATIYREVSSYAVQAAMTE